MSCDPIQTRAKGKRPMIKGDNLCVAQDRLCQLTFPANKQVTSLSVKWDNYFQYLGNPSQNTPKIQTHFPFGAIFHGFLYSDIPQILLLDLGKSYIINLFPSILERRDPPDQNATAQDCDRGGMGTPNDTPPIRQPLLSHYKIFLNRFPFC